MKEYRVTYISEHGNRTHKDYKTLQGAIKFVDNMGRNDCLITKHDYRTFCFEPVSYEELTAKRNA